MMGKINLKLFLIGMFSFCISYGQVTFTTTSYTNNFTGTDLTGGGKVNFNDVFVSQGSLSYSQNGSLTVTATGVNGCYATSFKNIFTSDKVNLSGASNNYITLSAQCTPSATIAIKLTQGTNTSDGTTFTAGPTTGNVALDLSSVKTSGGVDPALIDGIIFEFQDCPSDGNYTLVIDDLVLGAPAPPSPQVTFTATTYNNKFGGNIVGMGGQSWADVFVGTGSLGYSQTPGAFTIHANAINPCYQAYFKNTFANNVDISSNKTLSIKASKPGSGTITLEVKLIDDANAESSAVPLTLGSTPVIRNLDFSSATGVDFTKIKGIKFGFITCAGLEPYTAEIIINEIFLGGTITPPTNVVMPADYVENSTVYPNPNAGMFTIGADFREAGEYTIDLVNMTGETYYELYKGFISSGYQTINFEKQGLPKGVYLLKIKSSDNETVISNKVVVY
ncbi:MAG: T9SS type A sorting domain-containing protein [Cytophagaceae bacterium]|nr:T9SS type A sorting domain-containing protein [Cytophagaceae bacterium]MDW8456469.1 T9SS type A sorting domain-containing protein [Cytophagaceae bacterium]